MNNKTQSKRVHYQYFDNKSKQTLAGNIDIEMLAEDDFLPDSELKKYVSRKWRASGYKGNINSVTFEFVEESGTYPDHFL